MQEYQKQDYIDQYPIAMAYVPWQLRPNTYDNMDEAYKIGTIFPELNKPFKGRRRSR